MTQKAFEALAQEARLFRSEPAMLPGSAKYRMKNNFFKLPLFRIVTASAMNVSGKDDLQGDDQLYSHVRHGDDDDDDTTENGTVDEQSFGMRLAIPIFAKMSSNCVRVPLRLCRFNESRSR